MDTKALARKIAPVYLAIRKACSSKWLFKLFGEKYVSKDMWEEAKELPIMSFSELINRYDYKPDPIGGLLDFSHPYDEPEYFFADLKQGRDCDNWSRIWYCYLKYHSDEWDDVKEVVVLNASNVVSCFKTSHFITIAKNKKNGKYYCFNYNHSRIPHNTFEDAVYEVCSWSSFDKETLYWQIY